MVPGLGEAMVCGFSGHCTVADREVDSNNESGNVEHVVEDA